MTASMDFGLLPPEINSGRMYSGASSAPLFAAAAAWQGLAAELRSAAAGYGSVVGALVGDEWQGSSSSSMAAAAAPYVAWMNTTATQAELTAEQAAAAAGAYHIAFAATVPPQVVAANRAQLMSLMATNFLGQNTPAIAATEAQYAEMWAQDAAAMYCYAGSSATATMLSPFTPPSQTINPTGLVAQSAAVAQAVGTSAGTQQMTLTQLISAVPTTLQGLASSSGASSPSQGLSGIMSLLTGSGSGSSSLDSIWSTWGPNANLWNTVFSSGFYMPSNTMAPFLSLLGGSAAADSAVDAAGGAAASELGGALAAPLASAGGLQGLGGAVSAGLGSAASVGPLSVPPSWTATAPIAPLASALGGTPLVTPPAEVAAGLPFMPAGNMGGQGYSRAIPQYGFRPTVVAHPPAAG